MTAAYSGLGDHFEILRRGIPEEEHPTARKVWGALVSLAMAAQKSGWTQTQFETEVTGKRKYKTHGVYRWHSHRLWTQHRELNRRPEKSLESAWTAAVMHLHDQDLSTQEDMAAGAVEIAMLWDDRLLAGMDGLDEIDARIMDYVVVSVQKRRRDTVACPIRDVGAHAGCSKNTAARRLKALTEQGLLVCRFKGFPIKKFIKGQYVYSSGKASTFSLSNPLLLAPLTMGHSKYSATYVSHGVGRVGEVGHSEGGAKFRGRTIYDIVTAHHEAGHAVAAVMRGDDDALIGVTIEPTGEHLGYTNYRSKPCDRLFIVWAGPWAQARFLWSEADPDGADDDLEFADYRASAWLGNRDGDAAVYRRLLGDPLQVAADEAVRSAGADPERVREQVWNHELEALWPVIQEVASMLLRGEAVTTETVWAAVDSERSHS